LRNQNDRFVHRKKSPHAQGALLIKYSKNHGFTGLSAVNSLPCQKNVDIDLIAIRRRDYF
jgi:hypothetical protein